MSQKYLDLELRDSIDDTEEHDLLKHSHANAKPRFPISQRLRLANGSTYALIVSVIFTITGILTWTRVIFLLRDSIVTSALKTSLSQIIPLKVRYSSRVTFQPHLYYGGPPTNATNEMWRRLEPPGDGIVSIPKQYATSLHPSREHPDDPGSMIYGVSMFHQLHCLNFLRLAYFSGAVADMSPTEVAIHRDHCLDYIRQALMCHGDATFESINNLDVLDGMGATHQCRDFELMFSWAYEHRSSKTKDSGYKPEEVLTHTPAKQNDFNS